jgi:hypothetical protein
MCIFVFHLIYLFGHSVGVYCMCILYTILYIVYCKMSRTHNGWLLANLVYQLLICPWERIRHHSMMSTDNVLLIYKIIYLEILIYVLVKLVEDLLCEGIDYSSNFFKHGFLHHRHHLILFLKRIWFCYAYIQIWLCFFALLFTNHMPHQVVVS